MRNAGNFDKQEVYKVSVTGALLLSCILDFFSHYLSEVLKLVWDDVENIESLV